MARTRSIKPAFFKNEILGQLPYQDQLLFIGLWTLADRAGRLEDRPARIKAEVFPYRDVDIEASLCRLHQTEFIIRYRHGEAFIAIPTFSKHQSPHIKEQASTIPAPDMPGASTMQAHPYTGLPYTLNPETEVRVPPEMDEQWLHFKRLYKETGKPLIEEDFVKAHLKWRVLDFAQRTMALANLAERKLLHDAQYIPLPERYLQGGEYRRAVVARTNGNRMSAKEMAEL
jgi:hypothetical protein